MEKEEQRQMVSTSLAALINETVKTHIVLKQQ